MAQADSNSTSEFGTDAHFQAFRAPDEKELILIPVSLHPTLNELYVIWSDITNCFPETRRIQFRNVYVPLLRDTRLYRYCLDSFFLFVSLHYLTERERKGVMN